MAFSCLSTVFTGALRTGTARTFGVELPTRYKRVPASTMLSQGIHRTLSSATVYSSDTADATLILFASPVPDYSGRFMQITNRRLSGSALNVGRLEFGFNE